MDNFFGIQLGRFHLGFNRRTDDLTQMLRVGDPNGYIPITTPTEKWETTQNNEFKLYKGTSELFIPINRFATMVSNGVFKIKDYNTGKVIENHPLLMLLEKPNYLMNRNVWLEDIAVKYCIYGSSYTQKGKHSSLVDFPPFLMNLSNSELKLHYTGKLYNQKELKDVLSKITIPDRKLEFLPEDLIIFRRPNPDNPLMGLSVIESVIMEVSNARGAKGFANTNIMEKGGTTILSPKGSDDMGSQVLTDPEKQDLEKQFTQDYGGVGDKKSRVKLSKKQMAVDHVSYPIKDAMLFEEREATFLKTIDVLQLSKHIFSIKDTSKVSNNLKEGLIMSYQDSIMPFAEKLCYAINDSLGNFDKGYYVELDYSHLQIFKEMNNTKLTGDIDNLTKLISAGYTIEQAEKIIGFKTI